MPEWHKTPKGIARVVKVMEVARIPDEHVEALFSELWKQKVDYKTLEEIVASGEFPEEYKKKHSDDKSRGSKNGPGISAAGSEERALVKAANDERFVKTNPDKLAVTGKKHPVPKDGFTMLKSQ